MVRLRGQLICMTEDDRAVVLAHVADHIALTRAEPGCLSFDIAETDDPMTFEVMESFRDRAAFDAHQARTRTSAWYKATAHLKRDFRISGS